ncbi:MAG: hypothetical protein JW750_11855, partial [Anaerolineaceae bacterium]|nr:hypothetical protein [Anaerolineaceae bacterium]
LALSRMGYGRHPALEEGWQALEDHRDESGRYVLDWTMPKCDFKVGKADTANKWVTLYARLALKSRGD